MISLLDILIAVLLLALPIALGWLCTRVGLVEDVSSAAKGLNVFALYVGFPALIVSGLMDGAFTLPRAWAFWVVVPVTQVAILVWTAVLARLTGQQQEQGAVALTALFPNAGYLALPLSISLFGTEVAGEAALIVALHVAAGVSVGPWLLVRWSEADGVVHGLREVVRQPLVWSPIIGLLGRFLPEPVREGTLTAIAPLAAAAAPVALFILGLYIARHARDAHPAQVAPWLLVTTRLFVAPAIALAVTAPLVAIGALEPQVATIMVLFAAAPIAVTSLVIAAHVGVGVARIAGSIVISTIVSLATLPLTIRLAMWWFERLAQAGTG